MKQVARSKQQIQLWRTAVSFLCLICFLSVLSQPPSIPALCASPADAAAATWPTGPEVFSDAAILMEASTGLVLYEKDAYSAYYPASITKVMTALLALENCSTSEIMTMSYNAEHDVYGSRIGLVNGEQVTLGDALYGVLLESANEVSYGVAEHVSGTNMADFAEMMNARAAELGAVNSHFTNPHGLHEAEHFTCAYDMALIGRAAIAIPEFRKISGTRTYTIPPTNKNVARPLANHHRFIRKTLTYDYAIAGKTGGTTEALTTLITFAEKDGLLLICVVLHVDTALHAYEDTIKLFDFGFENYVKYGIEETELTEDVSFASLFSSATPFAGQSEHILRLGADSSVVLPVTADYKKAQKSIAFTPVAEIAHGENVIGEISYTYGGKFVGSADIVYYNDAFPVTAEVFAANWPAFLMPLDTAQIQATLRKQEAEALAEEAARDPLTDQMSETGARTPLQKQKRFQTIVVVSASVIVVLLLGFYVLCIELPYQKRKRY